MKVPVALAMLLASQIATADMAARIAAGKAATSSMEAKSYNAGVLVNLVLPTLRTCAPPGSNAPAQDWQLTLVGNVSAKGKVKDIEVEPANAITTCVAEKLKKASLLAPSQGIAGRKGFPLLVEVKMTNGAAQPRNLGAVTPVFSQIIAYSHPDNFKPVFENAYASTYIQEFAPEGESIEKWSQLITLTGARDEALIPGATPREFVSQIASRFSNACPGTFSSKVVGAAKISGHDAFVALLGCGTVQADTPRSEITLIATIKGRSDIYTIQWAERSGPIDKAPVFDDRKWGGRLQLLNPIRVCDRVAGEAAPYPSCVSGSASQ